LHREQRELLAAEPPRSLRIRTVAPTAWAGRLRAPRRIFPPLPNSPVCKTMRVSRSRIDFIRFDTSFRPFVSAFRFRPFVSMFRFDASFPHLAPCEQSPALRRPEIKMNLRKLAVLAVTALIVALPVTP